MLIGGDPKMDLRDAIQKIAVEWPPYGRPRMTKELRERGWTVEPEARLPADARGQSAGREQAQVCCPHGLQPHRKVYPNLAGEMVLTTIINCGGPISPTSGCATSSF